MDQETRLLMETQLALMEMMGDPELGQIESEFLENEAAVLAVIREFAESAQVQTDFLCKLPISDFCRLLNHDVIHEEMIVHLVLNWDFPYYNLVPFLKGISVDSRLFILNRLQQGQFSGMVELKSRLELQLDRRDGVYFEDVSRQAGLVDYQKRLLAGLGNGKLNIREFSELVFDACFLGDDYEVIVEGVLGHYGEFLNTRGVVNNKEQFLLLAKLSYLISLDGGVRKRFKTSFQAISERFFKTVLAYRAADRTAEFLGYLPEAVIESVLLLIDQSLSLKDRAIRNGGAFLKSGLEKLICQGRAHKLRKCIRRRGLPYTIMDEKGKKELNL